MTPLPLSARLRDMRFGLLDEGQLVAADVVEELAAIAQHVSATLGPDRTARDAVLAALADYDPCRCDPCPECGGLRGEEGAFDCTCPRCPRCGGLVDDDDEARPHLVTPPGPCNEAPQ